MKIEINFHSLISNKEERNYLVIFVLIKIENGKVTINKTIYNY